MSEDEAVLHAAGEALYRLSAAVVRGTAQPARMSLTSASTLAALSRDGAQRISELAAVQGVSQPSMTAVISALEQAGLVERAPDPTDGRAVLISATTEGREFLAVRREAMATQIAALARQLPDDEAAALVAAVPALVRLLALQERSTQSGAPGAPKAKHWPSAAISRPAP